MGCRMYGCTLLRLFGRRHSLPPAGTSVLLPRVATLAVVACLAFAPLAKADSFVLQGSTTFNNWIMVPLQGAIESASGQKLTVVPNKTSIGLEALLEKRADFAMISGPLDGEVKLLKKENADWPYAQLRSFEILRTRAAFAINKENPVRAVSAAEMEKILRGEILNWREVGGPDLPIRIVMVRSGGGVQASIEQQLLMGKPISAPDIIVVQISSQVVKIVEQEPGALGLAQLGVVLKGDVAELGSGGTIEQVLSLVTMGEPTPNMRKVIDAILVLAGDSHD
jgi:phosphate transport system substrate-binding protein